MKRCKNFKKFMEDDFIHMYYVCFCVVILLSLAIGFFLYGLAIECLTAFIGMIIVFICNVLKITVDINVVSIFSETTSYLVLAVFFACTTKYAISKIEVTEIE